MSEFLIYVKIPVYEREWCEHHFGRPCKFPAQSNINAVIRHFLRHRPFGVSEASSFQDDHMPIVIPDSRAKRARDFNYLSEPGRKAIAESINDLFSLHMFEQLTTPAARNIGLSCLIHDWMEENGISEEQYNNLRQKFLRIKDSYRQESGVNISRGYKHERYDLSSR